MNAKSIPQEPEKSKPGHSVIKHGDMKISPELASRILSDHFFPPQLDRLKTGALAIKRWAEFMRRGHWLDYSQITFCRLPDGALYLVNGYHRLSGVIEHGHAVWFNIVVLDVDSYESVGSKFSLFDRPTGTRMRGDEQLLNAIGFAKELGVKKTVARAIYRSIILIKNEMRAIVYDDRETLLKFDILETRADEAMSWAKECRILADAFSGARSALRQKLLNPSCFAVALYTVRFQEEKAKRFWTSVAENSGLLKGTPAHTLVERLLSERMVGGDKNNFLIPALAWNAFYRGVSMTMIKAGAANKLVILGTPVTGNR